MEISTMTYGFVTVIFIVEAIKAYKQRELYISGIETGLAIAAGISFVFEILKMILELK